MLDSLRAAAHKLAPLAGLLSLPALSMALKGAPQLFLNYDVVVAAPDAQGSSDLPYSSLIQRCAEVRPKVLVSSAEHREIEWCREVFGEESLLHDRRESGGGVLVSVRDRDREAWEASGGIFVTYDTAEQVSSELESLGVLRSPRKLFCDLDGVLADFTTGVEKVTGRSPDVMGNKMWPHLARFRDRGTGRGFYDFLGWMEDGKDLWSGIRHLEPTVLTGLPLGRWAEPQKRNWCRRELGADVEVICCMSRDKWMHLQKPGDILIDDRIKAKAPWEAAGGVFVHHTSAAGSLRSLRELGVLEAAEEEEEEKEIIDLTGDVVQQDVWDLDPPNNRG